ncbi:hypothetical protein KFU94_39905 [Chloroflexi bacterium TSY]|nr:hypothetical protein [Chloroflexi bacterium TSY]
MSVEKRKRSKKSDQRRSNKVGLWIIVAGAVLVSLVVILLSLNQSRSTAVDPDAYSAIQLDWQNRTTMGNPDAAVTVEAWEDFL